MEQDLRMTRAPNGQRVLVVDDEPNLAEVVTMALRFQGFEVRTAASASRPPCIASNRT